MPLPSTPSVPIMCQESFCLGMLACAVTKETGTAAGQQQACRQAGRELDSLRSPVSSAGTGAGPVWVLSAAWGSWRSGPGSTRVLGTVCGSAANDTRHQQGETPASTETWIFQALLSPGVV